jgi:formylglycine-generating enzyme required for sulfatase activity
MLPVGSKPAGDGKWGQSDLGGNVWEWTLDWARTPYRLTTCIDCADLQTSPTKTFRGGGFPNENFYLTTATRIDDVATDRDYDVGFRCARSP